MTAAPPVTDTQVRQLFVRVMRDSKGMDKFQACAFVGTIVHKSALEVGLIVGSEIMDDGWKRYVNHV